MAASVSPGEALNRKQGIHPIDAAHGAQPAVLFPWIQPHAALIAPSRSLKNDA